MAISKKVCLAGKNQIAVNALLYMLAQGWKDRLVVCANRTDSGASNWQPSLIRFAREFGVAVETLESVQKTEDLIFLSLEFDRLINPKFFRTSHLYNVHFSALPAYKGVHTSALPILHGASESGVTLHKIDSGIDTGAIIAQTRFYLPEDWTARDLYFAYMRHGFALFRDIFDQLIASDPPDATPQSAKGSTYFGRASIDYGNLSINLRDTAEGIIRQLRAFSFREYQTPDVHGLPIGDWQILQEESRAKPGTVLDQDKSSITIATIDFRLRLFRSRSWDWFGVTAHSLINGIDPKFIDVSDKNGWTPLIRAAYSGDINLCSRLLEAGADPNQPNTNGTTPIMYAFSGANAEGAARVLFDHGANPEQKDFFGKDLKSYHSKNNQI